MTSSPLDFILELCLKAMLPAALECELPHPAYGLTVS